MYYFWRLSRLLKLKRLSNAIAAYSNQNDAYGKVFAIRSAASELVRNCPMDWGFRMRRGEWRNK